MYIRYIHIFNEQLCLLSMEVDDYLLLSGIQHFTYCKRRWALVHLEQLWQDNVFTSHGKIMHKNADNPFLLESRGDIIISRSLPLVSHQLKLYGIADVVEFHASDMGIVLPNHEGLWKIIPIEYKSGKKREWECYDVQLCCQALCLEEMFHTSIPLGYLYYGKSRRRVEVVFNEELRERVRQLVAEMYQMFEASITPPACLQRSCENCSLLNLCLPQLSEKKQSVASYLRQENSR